MVAEKCRFDLPLGWLIHGKRPAGHCRCRPMTDFAEPAQRSSASCFKLYITV